jgi:hypothetical protein
MARRAPFPVRGNDHHGVKFPQMLGEDLNTGGVYAVVVRYENHGSYL